MHPGQSGFWPWMGVNSPSDPLSLSWQQLIRHSGLGVPQRLMYWRFILPVRQCVECLDHKGTNLSSDWSRGEATAGGALGGEAGKEWDQGSYSLSSCALCKVWRLCICVSHMCLCMCVCLGFFFLSLPLFLCCLCVQSKYRIEISKLSVNVSVYGISVSGIFNL